MEHVELLLAMASDENLRINAADAARLIHASPETAAKRLGDLENAGIVGKDSVDSKRYRYAPRSAQLRAAVLELSTMYQQRPVTLVRAIYERPASPVLSFAEAFRLRKED